MKFYIPYKGEKYCLSQCAKDTIQEYIIEPIAIILSIIVISVVTTILSLIVGLIADGLYTYFTGSCLVITISDIIGAGIAIMFFTLLFVFLIYILYDTFLKLKDFTYYLIDSKYAKLHPRKSCKLLVKCKE